MIDPRLGHMTQAQQKHVESIARQIARGLGHNDDSGMEWERYIAPAVIILNENPVLLRPDLKLAV
jgi:hypothetical protein